MINRHYLAAVATIHSSFQEKKDFPHVALFDFLDKEVYYQIRKELLGLSLSPEKRPLFHSYSSAPVPSSLRRTLFSPTVIRFIAEITGKKRKREINFNQAQVYSFSARDYTLLNDSYKEKPGIDLIFDFTDGWGPSSGGQITYVNGTGDALQLPIQPNMFALVRRQKNTQRFVKYLNHRVGKKKRLFVLVRISE